MQNSANASVQSIEATMRHIVRQLDCVEHSLLDIRGQFGRSRLPEQWEAAVGKSERILEGIRREVESFEHTREEERPFLVVKIQGKLHRLLEHSPLPKHSIK